MPRTFVAASIVALTGLSCLYAPPQEEPKQEKWIPTGAGKIQPDNRTRTNWFLWYEIRSGENTHMVKVAQPMSLTDALRLREFLSSRRHHVDSIYEGEMTKDTVIKGWTWSR